VPGDRHQLRWVPARAFDLLEVERRDVDRDVLADAGLPLCRTRTGHLLGVERSGACHLVEGEATTPAATAAAVAVATAALPISSYHAGRCLDVDRESLRDGARVQQFTCSGASHQRWRLRPVNAAVGELYEIVVESSGKCLEVEGDGTQPGAGVQQQACDGGANQRWAPARAGNTFSLRPSSSGPVPGGRRPEPQRRRQRPPGPLHRRRRSAVAGRSLARRRS
jgi:hypothetical protein